MIILITPIGRAFAVDHRVQQTAIVHAPLGLGDGNATRADYFVVFSIQMISFIV